MYQNANDLVKAHIQKTREQIEQQYHHNEEVLLYKEKREFENYDIGVQVDKENKQNGNTKAEIRVLEHELEKFLVIDNDIRD
jgi:hypothetical protein